MTALALGVAVGVVCGLAYFGGLTVTVVRLPTARHPGLLAAGSLLVRLALVAVVLAALARWAQPAALAWAAIGIVVARTWLLRRWTADPAATTEAGETGWT